MLAALGSALLVLVLFLAGWQLAWRCGPYAAACFSISAIGGLGVLLAVAVAVRVRRRSESKAGAAAAAEGDGR